MSTKRVHEDSDEDVYAGNEDDYAGEQSLSSDVNGSPRKRARQDTSFPQTPAPTRRAPSCSSATPRTPYTPYPLYACDSPSNPFGRKRKEHIVRCLPPVTSFKKHITLRFQFVRREIHPRMGGVYRTVRVPTNYTFAHLRALVAWLYETPTRQAGSDDYLFEVKKKVSMYSPLYKPGQIKSGTTYVKVSNVRDPGRWESGYGLDEEDELLSQEEPDERASEAGEDWDWADEEDFTIGHVWPRDLDPLLGIIYHHSTDIQVHITLNTIKVPRQRGASNTPHVFNARGRVYLSHLPDLPRPLFTHDIPASSSSVPSSPQKQRTRSFVEIDDDDVFSDTDANGDVEFTSSHPYFQSPRKAPSVILVEDSDEEDFTRPAERAGNCDAVPNLSIWNEPEDAFASYHQQFMNSIRGPVEDDVDASFFEEGTSYDPFDDNDDDVIVTPAKPVRPTKVEYGDDDEDEIIDLRDSEMDDEAGEDEEYEEDQQARYALGKPTYAELNDEEDEDEGEFEYAPVRPTTGDGLSEEEDDGDVYGNVHGFNLGSTPDLTSRASSSLPGSSSPRLSSPPSEGFVLEEHYPNTKYTVTPAPPRRRTHRLRLGRLERRIRRIKSGEFLTAYDEVDDEEDAAEDQLANDNNEDKYVPEPAPPITEDDELWKFMVDEEEI